MKKTVFLTGATGNMGYAAFKELYKRRNMYNMVLLVLPGEKEKAGKDIYTPIKWKCHCGHEFEMSPNLVLKGGHWCPECLPMPWNYDEIAKHNPFFAQVWYSHHDKNENNVYTDDIYYAYSKD
jgi:hypothetical protein